MQNEKVPEWALERAVDLYHRETFFSSDTAVIYKHALARYIAEHEAPPVDPLLEEARDICSREMGADYSKQTLMSRGALAATYAALRRGIELARKEDSHAG